jgi:hypothetical protein
MCAAAGLKCLFRFSQLVSASSTGTIIDPFRHPTVAIRSARHSREHGTALYFGTNVSDLTGYEPIVPRREKAHIVNAK